MNDQDRLNVIATLDVDKLSEVLPMIAGRDTHFKLLILHKIRYESTDIVPELRHESGAWLRDHEYGRMTGGPLLPEGVLPSRYRASELARAVRSPSGQ